MTEHLEPTEEIALEAVKSRAARGVLVLTGRTFILNVIVLIAQGFLWVFLTPEQFGTFWLVSAVVNFLIYFSDVGLAAALIQKRDKPRDEDYWTTFTVQQSLVILLLVILALLSPFFEKTYGLTTEGRYLLYALGFSFFLSSLKSIPSVRLERKLEFGRLVIPQVLETLVYNIAVVFLAWKGMGITAFTYAVVVRGVVGVVAIYFLSPWKPKITISRGSLKELLKFGVPYQANTLLAVIKDDGMTILLGWVLGPVGVGILGTAQRLSQYPLRFFMDNVTKVTFPAFARLQHDKDQLAKAVTKSVFFITFFVFPSTIGLVVLSPVLVSVIPKYEKWAPALIPLALLSINTIMAGVTTQLTNLFNAIGKIKITFGLMVMWTTLTLMLVPFLASSYGPTGAALGYALVGTSSLVAIYISKRHVGYSVWDGAGKTFLAAFLMGIVVWFARGFLPISLLSMFLLIFLGSIVYLSLIVVLYGAKIIVDVKKGVAMILGK